MASLTRIFDGLYVDQLFHKTERGETVYYPFGLLGRGYLLPADREERVRRATRRLTFFSIATVVGLALVANLAFSSLLSQTAMAVVAVLVVMAACVYLQLRLVSGLAPMAGQPSRAEWFRRGRAARAPWTSWVSIAFGLVAVLFAAVGFAMGFSEGDTGSYFGGGFFLLVGALLIWDGTLGLIERAQAARKN